MNMEKSYKRNVSILNFKTKEWPYELRFKDMMQKNVSGVYSTERRMRRRPIFCKDVKAVLHDGFDQSNL